jgi:hypothetical protein
MLNECFAREHRSMLCTCLKTSAVVNAEAKRMKGRDVLKFVVDLMIAYYFVICPQLDAARSFLATG